MKTIQSNNRIFATEKLGVKISKKMEDKYTQYDKLYKRMYNESIGDKEYEYINVEPNDKCNTIENKMYPNRTTNSNKRTMSPKRRSNIHTISPIKNKVGHLKKGGLTKISPNWDGLNVMFSQSFLYWQQVKRSHGVTLIWICDIIRNPPETKFHAFVVNDFDLDDFEIYKEFVPLNVNHNICDIEKTKWESPTYFKYDTRDTYFVHPQNQFPPHSFGIMDGQDNPKLSEFAFPEQLTPGEINIFVLKHGHDRLLRLFDSKWINTDELNQHLQHKLPCITLNWDQLMSPWMYLNNYNNGSLTAPRVSDHLPKWKYPTDSPVYDNWRSSNAVREALSITNWLTQQCNLHLNCLSIYGVYPQTQLQIAEETVAKIKEYEKYFIRSANITRIGTNPVNIHQWASYGTDTNPEGPCHFPISDRRPHRAGEFRYARDNINMHQFPDVYTNNQIAYLWNRPSGLYRHTVVYRGITTTTSYYSGEPVGAPNTHQNWFFCRNFSHTTLDINIAANFCHDFGGQCQEGTSDVHNVENGKPFILQIILTEGIPYLAYDGDPFRSCIPHELEVLLMHHIAIKQIRSGPYKRYMHSDHQKRYPVIQCLAFPHPTLENWLQNSHNSNTCEGFGLQEPLIIRNAEHQSIGPIWSEFRNYVNQYTLPMGIDAKHVGYGADKFEPPAVPNPVPEPGPGPVPPPVGLEARSAAIQTPSLGAPSKGGLVAGVAALE